jgi:hypothetical protein
VTPVVITAAQIDVLPHGSDGGEVVGKRDGVLPYDTAANVLNKIVGVWPSDYSVGEGTIISGAEACAAVRNAEALYPGGIIDRVVVLSMGNFALHDDFVEWPHHVFETKNLKVEGAGD